MEEGHGGRDVVRGVALGQERERGEREGRVQSRYSDDNYGGGSWNSRRSGGRGERGSRVGKEFQDLVGRSEKVRSPKPTPLWLQHTHTTLHSPLLCPTADVVLSSNTPLDN